MISKTNAARYRYLYTTKQAFLRYPAEWVIRFHALQLRHRPAGRILDFGFGSGNNLRLFADNGWRVSGVETSAEAIELARQNDVETSDLRLVTVEQSPVLPWKDETFDVVLANQVLYYLTRRDQGIAMAEFRRVLIPGGWLAMSMMGAENEYAGGRVGLVEAHPPPRLSGPPELIWVLEPYELQDLIGREFSDVQLGYYDSRLPWKGPNFHWVAFARRPRA